MIELTILQGKVGLDSYLLLDLKKLSSHAILQNNLIDCTQFIAVTKP